MNGVATLEERKLVRETLKSLGFKMSLWKFGTRPAEKVNVGKDHFTPLFRDVFFGEQPQHGGFFYVTSHVKGKLRRYRCRNVDDVEFNNFFASGKTVEEALNAFKDKFKVIK